MRIFHNPGNLIKTLTGQVPGGGESDASIAQREQQNARTEAERRRSLLAGSPGADQRGFGAVSGGSRRSLLGLG